MKKFISFLMAVAIVNLLFTSCERDKDNPPEMPPYESMAIDFSNFGGSQKSADDLAAKSTDETAVNYAWAGINVGFFNLVLTVTLIVPVAAFQTAISQPATYLGDNTWQWSFAVDGFASEYTARMTGEVLNETEEVYWEMYVSKQGVGAFEEFLWFTGTSKQDGTGGQWLLNHSNVFQEPMLQIDWERTGEEMGDIKYTVVRELNDNRLANAGYGSYIEAGRTEAELDAYYNIFLAETDRDVFIEWSTTTYFGRIMDEQSFLGPGWHCWDNNGYDIVCAE